MFLQTLQKLECIYNCLYSEQFSWRPKSDGLPFDSIGDDKAGWMERVFQGSKVFEVEKALNEDTGPNSFSLAFFQTCQDVLKQDIMNVFHEFHVRGMFERSLDATFIAHFPKQVGVVGIMDFHRINVVGGIYKIISKVLANTLKTVLEKVISKTWNVLIRGDSLRLNPYCQPMS